MSFPDNMHGWAVGGAFNEAVVLYTEDGGNTWTQDTTVPTSLTLWGVAFSSTNEGIVMGNGGIVCRFSQPTMVDEDDHLSEARLEVYPNPSSGRLTLRLPHSIHEVSVYNSSGRLMQSIEVNDRSVIQLDFHGKLTPGTYFFKAGKETRPFVILK